jgi:LCP family protein required for cell wall assembly
MNKKHIIIMSITALVIAAVLTGAFISISSRLARLEGTMNDFSASIRKELEEQHAVSQSVLRNQRTVTRNLQETREALNLPSGSYEFPGSGGAASSGTGESSGSADDSVFYRAVDGIAHYYARKEIEKELHDFLEAQRGNLAPLTQLGGGVEEHSGSEYGIVVKNYTLFVVNGQPAAEEQKPFFRVAAFDGDEKRVSLQEKKKEASEIRKPQYSLPGARARELIRFINAKTEDFRAAHSDFRERAEELQTLLAAEELRSALQRKELKVRTVTDAYNAVSYALHPRDEEQHLSTFGTKVVDDGFRFNAEELAGLQELRTQLLQRIEKVDPRSPEEREVARAKQRVLKVAKDPAFKAYLRQHDLRISASPREDQDYFYFDLLDEEGERFGAFAVLKKVGEIYLADHEDVIISSIKSVHKGLLTAPRTAPAAGGKGGQEASMQLPDEVPEQYTEKLLGGDGITTVLLCGTHKKNADTIILARMKKGGSIRLLSVPRDLYYQGRKLSSYFRIYGVRQFRELVSSLTGVQIDGYVVVDMYAFIDVVDILGGINVTLEQPLIDPTYKVRDHGEWKTLHFSAGKHHLNGIEALRVARSRHTSDDFDRARRQQLILDGLRRKINRLHAGKLEEVYKIFRTIGDYISTDFSPYELAQLFLAYRSTEITETAGMSTDNVLYATYSNLYHKDLTKEEVSDDFYKGAWILLPKENNWKLIKWYTRKTFEHM